MPEPLIFTGNPLDRASNQRHDAAWIEERLASLDSRFLLFSGLNVLAQAGDAPQLGWLDASVWRTLAAEAAPLLLGVRDGLAHFAVDVSSAGAIADALGLEGATFAEVRGLAQNLPAGDAGIVAHARALIDWHQRHRYCGACGSEMLVQKGGGSRKCPACGQEQFPRTDPVVIMVVWRGERCLLGRRSGRPGGAYSCLAGFVDQGESIEEAVRREVFEEASVVIDDVVYHASQPWPFPYSLMIGCFAHAASDDFKVDDLELADVRWFTKDEVRAAIHEPVTGGLTLPGRIAIAHHLLKDWCEDVHPDIT